MIGDVEIARAIESPRLVSPWRWQFNDDLSYLVYALVARRKPSV
jgi:hypothetical protein